MRFVKPLSESAKLELTTIFREGDSHRLRRRAHTILLSAEGFAINEIARIYRTDRDTVASAFDRWEEAGITGLYDGDKSGRPTKLTKEESAKAIEYLKEDPRSTKKALAKTQKKRVRKSVNGH